MSDRPKAELLLSHLNYYRFSGYCLAFEAPRHNFNGGVSFEHVFEAYQFDLTLRDLLTEALEIVEVDLRAAMAYEWGHCHGAFGHTDSAKFFVHFKHSDWLSRLKEESGRSSELFVEHFKQKYSEFPNLPVWIVTEVMSFGMLSRMFKGMNKSNQTPIARRYRLQPNILASWMHHCVYIRNLCAHHSRLWDRVWAIKPQLPHGKDWQAPLTNLRLFPTLLLLRRLMHQMPAAIAFNATWKVRIEQHLDSPPKAPNAFELMGLPRDWRIHPAWNFA
ncbi:MAG: Abi family protein [Pirellulaceae bacterium]